MKIKKLRETQTTSFEDFFSYVIDNSICNYCENFKECQQIIGEEVIEMVSGKGCDKFDNSIENIKNFFLKEKCAYIGT